MLAASATLLAAAGCTGSPRPALEATGATPSDWEYHVVAGPGARELLVEAWFPRASSTELGTRKGAEAFMHEVEVETSGRWRPVAPTGGRFGVQQCAQGCHLRYRFDLDAAASGLADADIAVGWGALLEAPASTWLLRPVLAPYGVRYRVRVQVPDGLMFETGTKMAREDGRNRVFEADASTLSVAPYSVFGPLHERRIDAIPGVEIDLVRGDRSVLTGDDDLTSWVARSARVVARFFDRFPVNRLMVLVVPVPGDEVLHGETMGDGGASIVVHVGERTTNGALQTDWVLPHEMIHLVVPSVSSVHHWIEEGLAVYFEPVARARLGILSPEEVWLKFASEMPGGLPVDGSRGLDGDTEWHRTYWGGALFCLLADLEIRRRSGGRCGLDDAIRGVLARGGSVATIWPFDRLVEVADSAVGLDVLRSLHDEMGREPWSFDLPRLFGDLGVRIRQGRVRFDDQAPLAAVRRSITAPLLAARPSMCKAQ